MQITSERFSHIALSVLLVLVLANALAAGLHTVSDLDMGWHLATGRWVVQHHAVPSTDVLSYTTAGAKWIYPPFAGALMYLIFIVAGYAGLSMFCALACLAAVAYLVRRRDLASLALTICAIDTIAARTGPRADLFSTVFFTFFLGELWSFQRGDSKRLWILPLIMLFWVNLHPGFILGLAAIGAYLLLETCDLLFSAHRAQSIQRLRTAWPWLTASVAVTVMNPWGAKLYSASFALAGLHGQQQGAYDTSALNQEFLSVPLSTQLLTRFLDFRSAENGFSCLLVIAVVVVLVAIWQKQFGVAICQASALYFALQHLRYIGLFCITTTIIGSTILGEAFTPQPSERARDSLMPWPTLSIPPSVRLVFIFALCAAAVLHTADFISNRTHVVSHTESRFGVGESVSFPERAASFIKREHLPGNIFEKYELGGFAAWRLGPEYPDFIDGRSISSEVLVEEKRLGASPPDSQDWQAAADKWGINVILVPEGAGGAVTGQDAYSFCSSTRWTAVYMDETSLVLLRNTPANQPWLDRLQVNCFTREFTPPATSSRKDLYDYWANAGALLFALQRDKESELALLRALAIYPNDPNARLILGQLYHSRQMFAQAETQYQAILAESDSDIAQYLLGKIYVQEKRLPDAERAFSNAAHMSIRPFAEYMELAQVELWMQRPESALRAYDDAEGSSPYRNGAEGLAPGIYADIADGRAEAQRMLSHVPQAIAYEQESVRLNPGVADRWYKLAALLDASGQRDASQSARQRAIEVASGTR